MSHQASLYDPSFPELLRKAAAAYRRRDDKVFRALLEKAVTRCPNRLDLRFCLASHHIQAGQPELALDIYEELTRLVPRDVDVLFCLAHWRRYLGDGEGAEQARRLLAMIRAEKAADLSRVWRAVDAWRMWEPSDRVPTLPEGEGGGRKAIVVLGHALTEEGGIRPELVERLEKTLEAAERFPDAVVVVSGGVPKGGRVEAEAMRDWLLERGVAAERIYEEGYSRDVVENLVYTRQILDLLDVEAVLVITSAGNVRRVGAALDVIAYNAGSAWIARVAAASGDSFARFKDNGGDLLKLHRDVLRAYGMPMMQSYPDLVER